VFPTEATQLAVSNLDSQFIRYLANLYGFHFQPFSQGQGFDTGEFFILGDF